ncbi:MAG: transcription antitermination factor NusB [Lachnospiraceae bacterium]|nr:transcription antitermination factor NusB [Lachnospiraceae bacterium]
MGKREQREQLFKLVFMTEFNHPEEMPEQIAMYFAESQDAVEDDKVKFASEKEQVGISERFNAVMEKLPEINEIINKNAVGWTTERMGKVEVAIIRVAVFEMKFDENVPQSVAINEAVELAKKFGQDESASFVNGILAKIAK